MFAVLYSHSVFMYYIIFLSCVFFFSSRRRHTRCALVTGVQTCALPILKHREVVDLRVAKPFGDRVHDWGEGRATAFARLQQAKLQGEVRGLLTGEARIVREARHLLQAVAGKAGGHAARRDAAAGNHAPRRPEETRGGKACAITVRPRG